DGLDEPALLPHFEEKKKHEDGKECVQGVNATLGPAGLEPMLVGKSEDQSPKKGRNDINPRAQGGLSLGILPLAGVQDFLEHHLQYRVEHSDRDAARQEGAKSHTKHGLPQWKEAVHTAPEGVEG